MENVRGCNVKKLLHVGSTIINIAAHLAHCNIEFFFSSFKITLVNFTADKKDHPPFP